ncbi:MAG: carboxypeptidase-like regulatory domain-containing protein [Bacteroidales bacterium]|nr:carboxypeptidase-like regulatory domain-containing protein [Bacteroidales bacterium]
MDEHSRRPIVAANVSIPDRGIATVTNEDGSFVIKSDTPIVDLVFSHIGYRSVTLKGKDGMKVLLPPVAYALQGASIISGDPKQIVRLAVDKIIDNYPDKAELLRCFYRETIKKRSRYIGVSEAVAKMYKSSYGWRSVSADRTALEKSRIIMSQRRRDTLSVVMVGGPTSASKLDLVKNPDILLNPEDLDLYIYHMESPAYIGERLNFVISIEPGYIAEYPLYYGRLYIDRETLAFSRIELSMDMSDAVKATRVMLLRKPSGLRFSPKELSLVISYRPGEDGSMRLNYFRSQMGFNCDWKRRLFATSYTAVSELVVTEKIEPAVQIPRTGQFRSSDVLVNEAPLFLDPDFWKDYNIIEPSESLEDASGRLVRQAATTP